MPKRPDLREFVMMKNTMVSAETMKVESPSNGFSSTTDSKSSSPPPKRSKDPVKDDDGYFSSYNDIQVHKLMLQDKPRTEAYKKAILDNSQLFKGKTVMDIGAGTGILSLFCMKAGATKVYAVEASPLVDLLREIVELNDEGGVVEVIHGRAEDIDLPVKVDIIVSEWMGFYLLHESMLDSVIKARDRHLEEDGVMFPSNATIYGAPVQMDHYISDNVDYWEDVHGFNMNPVAQRVLENKLAGGSPEILTVSESQLLSEPALITEFDLRWVQLDEVMAVRDRKFVSISRNGKFHGIAIWFQTDFKPLFYDEEITENFKAVTLDTSPMSPETHWKQTVIIVPRNDVEVEQDEVVGWELSMEQAQDNPRNYQLGLSLLDPSSDEHPMPCACKMARCALYAALLQKEEDDLEQLEEIPQLVEIQNGVSKS